MTDPFYTAPAVMPPESTEPGKIAKLGHGDALHVANIDPDRQGLEIFMVHESGASGPYGYTRVMRQPARYTVASPPMT